MHDPRSSRRPGRRSGMHCNGCTEASGGRLHLRGRPFGRRRGAQRGTPAGPSPAATPVQRDVYGFMRSPVDDRGSNWRKTSRSSSVGRSFSMPRIVISVCGSVVQNRPLPSDSTTQTEPVSAMPKLAPLIPTDAVRNFSRRYVRAAPASSAGSSVRSGTPSSRRRDRGSRDGSCESPARGCGTAFRPRAGRSARRDQSRSAGSRLPRVRRSSRSRQL